MIAIENPRRAFSSALTIVVALLGGLSAPYAQENARVVTDAYIYLYPDSTRKPFAKLEAESLVTILGAEADWFNITIVDTKGERRYGYVRQRAIQRLPPTLRSKQSAVTADSTRERQPSAASAAPSAEPQKSVPAIRAEHTDAPPTAAPSRHAQLIRLQDVRRIFIEPMSNDLDQFISAEITKEFKGSVVVVLKKEDADAILRGAGENKTGVGAAITGRYLGLHDNASASVSLVDRDETVVLWATEAGDRSLMKGVWARGGPRKVAERLVNNLRKALTGR